ncbi:MAG: YfiR family protein [Candidatus Eisenbacteria bacterium]|uniref:YfiR family protein n=1 Tax=Eiseniibacteriota bacterium TaxID=2212470 RepID=A0A7Y2H3U8_UNCEI|nr:YfiR family protein [Candidatus Eisenbacteria bacterium]
MKQRHFNIHSIRLRQVLLGPLLVMVCALGVGVPSVGAESSPTEHEVKAAFIFYFAKFTSWPDSTFKNPKDPFVIGYFGEDPVVPALLNLIDGKSVAQHPFELRKINADSELSDLNILYISPSKRKLADEVLDSVQGTSILTISAMEGFIPSGGIVNFFIRNNRVRFDVNVEGGKEAGLEFRSKLLRIAANTERSE